MSTGIPKWLLDSEAVRKRLEELHNDHSKLVPPGGANGTFNTYRDRLEGFVLHDDVIIGVWATRGETDRVNSVVFYRFEGREPLVKEFRDVNWSLWDIVENARDW